MYVYSQMLLDFCAGMTSKTLRDLGKASRNRQYQKGAFPGSYADNKLCCSTMLLPDYAKGCVDARHRWFCLSRMLPRGLSKERSRA